MGLVLAFSLLANSARAELPVRPDHLPKYDLDIVIDVQQKRVEFKQRVTWTNTTQTPTRQLVFNFYPLYKIPDGESLLLSKTLELLRMQPSYGIDRRGCMARLIRFDYVTAVTAKSRSRSGRTTRRRSWWNFNRSSRRGSRSRSNCRGRSGCRTFKGDGVSGTGSRF